MAEKQPEKQPEKPVSDDKKLSDLQAENAKLKAAESIRLLEAENAKLRAGGKGEERAKIDLKREKLRADTHKVGGFAHYMVGKERAFHKGVMLEEGAIVRLPVDELPSHTFTAVQPADAGTAFAPKATAGRPSDKEV